MTGAIFLACVAVFLATVIVLGLLASRRLRISERALDLTRSGVEFMGIAAFLLVASFGSAVLS